MDVGSIVLRTVGFFVGMELLDSLLFRRAMRRRIFRQAVKRAEETGKPLLVVGDPDTGIVNPILGRDYHCGDVCTDLTGCPSCPTGVKGPLEKVLPQMPTSHFVIYVSCVLEYVDDIELVIRELWRVSGGDLFVAHVDPMSLTARFYPGAKRRIFAAPPAADRIVYLPL
jgi:hypothetical protein